MSLAGGSNRYTIVGPGLLLRMLNYPLSTMSDKSWSTASSESQMAFGVLASGIGIATVWQGHRFWKVWKKHHSQLGAHEGARFCQYRLRKNIDNFLGLELGLSPPHMPSEGQRSPETALSSIAAGHKGPYPASVKDSTVTREIDDAAAVSLVSISPLDLNEITDGVSYAEDPFEVYAVAPRRFSSASCTDVDLSPRLNLTLSKRSSSLDHPSIATPWSEFHRHKPDRTDLLNLGKAGDNPTHQLYRYDPEMPR